MNADEILRLVDVIHRDKNIDRELIFSTLENALLLAARKYFSPKDDEELNISVTIDRNTGRVIATKDGEEIDPAMLGRISAHAAKQSIIQRIREAESKAIYQEYADRIGELEVGTVQRIEHGAALVTINKTEAILPRSEQIPGESYHVGQRIKAIIREVKEVGPRVRIILSRSHPDFVRRLFEQEIPEIQDRTIDIRAIAREAGYRTKIAVSSIDLKVDAVGACVGVRGSRIKNIVDELNGERIDIVRYNESLQVMIPNALQPAQIEEVFLYPRLGRAIVLVREDQLSLAIGRRGQNVRLASKLVGWDIEIMTAEEYSESIDRAKNWFLQIPGMTDDMTEVLITEGFLSYDDLTFMEPEQLAELIGVTPEEAEEMIIAAEELAEQVEVQKKELDRQAAEARAAAEETPSGETEEAPASAEEAVAAEPQHTVESIFGSDALEAKQEEKLDPHKIFGMEPSSQPRSESSE
ncbi:MAG: transcription termination factor NusA [Gemmatales bacterium]|nr:transcription termination factor NusA [Gemmatales bacterium]MDW8387729.1 transcription termination factor NusA [Gemmatales bacterium]